MRTRTMIGVCVAWAFVAVTGGCQLIAGLGDPRLAQPDGGTSSSTGSGSTCSASEVGKDCGGTCPPCPDGEGCKTGSDCVDKVCSAGGLCLPPTCSDMVQNGAETDVDCGGPMCGPCAFGEGCKVGTDCVTGFCNGKTCDATPIAGGLMNPNSLAVDAQNVYWTDADLGVVMMADIATGTQSMLASGQVAPQGLVLPVVGDLRAGSILWVEPTAGNVDTLDLGNPGSVQVYASGQASPSAVAPGVNSIYWANQGTPPQPGTLMSLSVASFPGNVLGSIGNTGDRLIVAPNTADILVYTTVNTLQSFQTDPIANPIQLVPSGNIAGLAADATFAYWTDAGMGTVARIPIAGGTPAVLASQQAMPADVTVDLLYVYWINQGASAGAGAVMKAALANGSDAPVVLASGQVTPRSLFALGNNVYWISGAKGQGAVKTVPK
jgi:hypothetical protein